MKPKLTHRIDRQTSGLLLLAKSTAAAQAITQAFKTRAISKRYLAIVAPSPATRTATITAPLQEKYFNGRIEKTVVDEGGKQAHTDYDIIDQAGKQAALLALSPLTGRMHQLRAHMAYAESPILGDRKYGEAVPEALQPMLKETSVPLCLHAWQLTLPDGILKSGAHQFTAPPAPDFLRVAQVLGLSLDISPPPHTLMEK